MILHSDGVLNAAFIKPFDFLKKGGVVPVCTNQAEIPAGRLSMRFWPVVVKRQGKIIYNNPLCYENMRRPS